MPANHCDDYFLTRHHAHLLEALDQAVARGGSLSVIHGETGLGKSRLLQAFIDHRCRDRRWMRLVFLPQGMARIELPDRRDTAPLLQHEMLPELQSQGGCSDVWIVDQFELALPHGRDALWQALAGCERQPALIVAGQLQWPDAWRDLLPEQTGELHEAAVQPLDTVESRDYLDRHVCGEPGRGLRDSKALRRIIRDSRGRIPLLQDAAQVLEASDCIAIEPGVPGRGRWLLVLLLFVVVGAVACLLFCPATPETGAIDRSDQAPLAAAEKLATGESASAQAATSAPRLILPEATAQTESAPEDAEPANPPVADSAVEPNTVTTTVEPQEKIGAEPAATMTEPAVIDPFDAYAAWPLLHRRLRATAQWLLDPGGNNWTIQLMTLSLGDDAASSLERHLQALKERGVSLERIGVYRAPAGADRKGHLGLLYGRYTSRETARSASSGLPPALRVKRFLLRSAASLRRDSELLPGN